MGSRHDSIGIKQVVRPEWYDFALDLLIDGASPKEIRVKLDEYVSERLQSGGYGDRGEQTYTKAVTQIMKSWVTPHKDLVGFRDDALRLSTGLGRGMRLPLHWAVTSAAYPFWHRVAEQVGRLLNLQDSICQNQIRRRCYEVFGERTTVERSSRRVIRSFVEWGVLNDSSTKGCYEQVKPVIIADQSLGVLLCEAALHASRDGKAALGLLLNSPAFFPFRLPVVTGDVVALQRGRIAVDRYGLDDEMLSLSRIDQCF